MIRFVLMIFLLQSAVLAQELRFAADRPIDVTHIRLDGSIDLKTRSLVATATLDLVALRDLTSIRLDAVSMDIKAVRFRRGDPRQVEKVEFQNDGKNLLLFLRQELRRGTKADIEIDYSVTDPATGLHFYGPTEAEPDVPFQVWSQGETTDNRHWIPCPDQPNERLTSELVLRAKADLDVLSNGKLVSRNENGDGTATTHWRQSSSHVPYLITLVVGKFAKAEEKWRGKPVRYWVPPERAADIPRSFGNTLRMLDFMSDKIGVEYPWDQYAQVVVEQFSFGGMENTSATTLNERTLHGKKAHLDFSSDGLVAHELAHQWFGDLLTCSDWAHIWLNEGFATYFEALWNEHDKGQDDFFTNMEGKSRGARSGGKKLPIVYHRYRKPFEQFGARAYPKGAWVLHMIRRRLGDEMWWKCVHRYVETHKHTSVETDDFRKTIEEVTGESFERFFHDWLYRPGHPVVNVRFAWKAGERSAEVEITQKQKGEAFHIPVELEFHFPKMTQPLRVSHAMTSKRDRLYIPLPERPSLVRVDPRFSVLMELTENKGHDLWMNQLLRDPSSHLRGRAAQHLSKSKRDADRKLLARALAAEKHWGTQIEIAKALGQSGGDVSRDVLLQALSLEHAKSRRAVVEALAKFRDDDTVQDALRSLVKAGDASIAVEAEAIRAWARLRPDDARAVLEPLLARDSHREQIRTAALQGLGEQQDPAAVDLLLSWTVRGKARECRASALQALGTIARGGELTPAHTSRIANACTACLHRKESRRIKNAATSTLRDLGEAGALALPALEALAEHDDNAGVSKQAKDAIEKIRSGAPARLELKRLQDELRKLRDQNKELSNRVEKLDVTRPQPVTETKGSG